MSQKSVRLSLNLNIFDEYEQFRYFWKAETYDFLLSLLFVKIGKFYEIRASSKLKLNLTPFLALYSVVLS